MYLFEAGTIRDDSRLDVFLWAEGVVELPVVDRRRSLLQAMGHADLDGAGADAPLAVVRPKGQLVDPAVARAVPFRAD